MIYGLLFLACLASEPNKCTMHFERLMVDRLPTQIECGMFGQFKMAEWQRAHPTMIAKPPYRCVEMYPTGGEIDI